MKITRCMELSLYYKVQDVLSVFKAGDTPKSADFTTYNLKYKNIQPKYDVTVRINGNVATGGYTVDYAGGVLRFSAANLQTDVVTVDYTYCPVHVYDESQNPDSADTIYPAVAIYEGPRRDVPYELGNARKEIHAQWVLEVWAARGGERNDFTDMIIEMFNEDLAVFDYTAAFPLLADGTKNPAFDESNQRIAVMTCDSINSDKGGSLEQGQKPTYVSQVYADLIVTR